MGRRSLQADGPQSLGGVEALNSLNTFSPSLSTGTPFVALYRQIEISRRPLRYIGNEDEFRAPDAWANLVEAQEPPGNRSVPWRGESTGEPLLTQMLALPLLTAAQEQYLFRKMNYLKFVADQVRSTLSETTLEPKKISYMGDLLKHSNQIRERIFHANLKLVIHFGARFVGDWEERLSVGSPALLRAVDTFDYQRCVKLSTYATWTIKREFLNNWQREAKRLDSQRLTRKELNIQDSSFDISGQSVVELAEARYARQKLLVCEVVKGLGAREREIIERYYGIGDDPARTLEEIGDQLGISKERVRQIKLQILRKLFDVICMEDALNDA